VSAKTILEADREIIEEMEVDGKPSVVSRWELIAVGNAHKIR